MQHFLSLVPSLPHPGGGGAEDAGVAPLAKRQKLAASTGESPAQAPAVPVAAPQAGPQSAVHICNAMHNKPPDLRERCKDMFRRIAARLRPVPPGCESYDARVKAREALLTKLRKAAGKISGDRYELWLKVVRVQGASCIFVPSLPVCNPLHRRTTTAQKSSDPPRM
jgi:hypothetical protein